jgi:hypothetical protein
MYNLIALLTGNVAINPVTKRQGHEYMFYQNVLNFLSSDLELVKLDPW